MDLELYNEIRNTPCKIHKLLSIKESLIEYKIENDYIITFKSDSFLNYFNSYSQFKEEFLNKFKNIDCYKITKFINNSSLSSLYGKIITTIEISNIDEENFNKIKDNESFIALSGIVLIENEKSIIEISPIMEPILTQTSKLAIKQITIESYNNLYELSLGEDIKIENIEIL